MYHRGFARPVSFHMHQGSGLHVACVDIKQTWVHLSYLHALAPVSEHLVSYYFVVWSIRKILDELAAIIIVVLCFSSQIRAFSLTLNKLIN